MERFFKFGGFDFDDYADDYTFAFGDSETVACPRYMRRLMDRDVVHMSVSDIPLDEVTVTDADFESSGFKKISLDVACFFLNPAYLREQGFRPELLISFDNFKKRSVAMLFGNGPSIDISNEEFKKRVWNFINEKIHYLYYESFFEDAKSVLRDLLTFFGYDIFLGYIGDSELGLYNTSYLSYVRILYHCGIYTDSDIEALRYDGAFASSYLKKVPTPNGWDFKSFIEFSANHIVFTFYRSFGSSSSSEGELYEREAERWMKMIETVLLRFSTSIIKNKKGEIWELNHPDLFHSFLRKKILALIDEVPSGLRDDFYSCLPRAVQSIIDDHKKVYRPWKRLK